MREAVVALALCFGLSATADSGQKSPAADGKGAPQVMVHVRIMEISRTKLRNLGYYDSLWKERHGSVGLGRAGGRGQAQAGRLQTVRWGNRRGRLSRASARSQVLRRAQIVAERQLVKMLAEPDMLAVSGGTCSVLQGGEFAFPVAQGRKDAAETKPHETSWLDWLCPAGRRDGL